jgi:hypothetical protein
MDIQKKHWRCFKVQKNSSFSGVAFEEEKEAEDAIFREVIENDPLLKNFSRLKDVIQQREKYFLHNSIRGFLRGLSKEK